MMIKNNLLKETAIYAIGEIVPKIISFVLLPIYTHYLSPKDYGIISYTNSVVIFLFILSSLALNSFVIRNYFEKKDVFQQKLLLGNVYLFIGIFNLSLICIYFLVFPPIIKSTNLQVPWNPYFKLALISNFLDVFSIIPLVVYRVKQKARFYIILTISRTLFQFGLTFTLIVVLKKGIIGHYYGRLFSLIPFFFIYWALMSKEAIFRLNLKQIKEGLKFSLPLIPGAIAYLAISFSDRIILERFVNLSQIGIYNIAYTLAFSLNMIIQSGYRAIEPEIFKKYGTPEFPNFIDTIQSRFLFVVFACAMAFTLFSQEVFKIMASEKYYEGYLLVPIIMLGAILTAPNVIFGSILQAEKNTKAIGIASMTGAIASILFNIAFIPHWGVYAAAISSALAFLVMNLILYFRLRFKQKKIGREIISLLLFCLFTFVLFYLIRINYSFINSLLKVGILMVYIFINIKLYKIDLSKIIGK